jgi:hypothetical protein
MSFSRPGGPYSVGATLPSADVNAAWTDITNALDKSTAGDTLSGVVTMASTAAIDVANAGANITSSVAGGIIVSAAAGLKTTAAGGFQLAGGSTDWPTFSSNRSYSKAQPLLYTSLATSWTNVTPVGSLASYGIFGGATTTSQPILLPAPHNGATLASIAILLTVVSHANVPANLPTIAVFRLPVTAGVGTPLTAQALSTSSPQSFSPTPASGAAWYSSGDIQALVFSCNQNNVVDNANYIYGASIVDENGSNSATGNFYYAVGYSYTTILNMAFP